MDETSAGDPSGDLMYYMGLRWGWDVFSGSSDQDKLGGAQLEAEAKAEARAEDLA